MLGTVFCLLKAELIEGLVGFSFIHSFVYFFVSLQNIDKKRKEKNLRIKETKYKG